jgi:hypothetical protein
MKKDLESRIIDRTFTTHLVVYLYTISHKVDHHCTDTRTIHRSGQDQRYDRLAIMILSSADGDPYYNCGFNLKCTRAWGLTNFTGYWLQTKPVLHSSSTTGRDEDAGSYLIIQTCTEAGAEINFSDQKSSTFCCNNPSWAPFARQASMSNPPWE